MAESLRQKLNEAVNELNRLDGIAQRARMNGLEPLPSLVRKIKEAEALEAKLRRLCETR